MGKFNAGQIIAATKDHSNPFGEPEIVVGNLYHAGHDYGFGDKGRLWVVNEQGVNAVYPETDFERANIKHLASTLKEATDA